MGHRVLVSRSGQAAAELAERLTGLGFEPVLLPLTEFRRMPVIAIPDADEWDAVAVTSANAIRLAPPELLQRLAAKPCYAVGRHTADAARGQGLPVRLTGAGGGAALGRSMADEAIPPERVLFLCGRNRSRELEIALQDAGICVHALEIYDSRPIAHTSDFISASIGWKSVWGALVYSAQVAEELRKVAVAGKYSFLFENARYVCISERVAEALRPVAGTVAVSGEPNEDAMLRTLAALR